MCNNNDVKISYNLDKLFHEIIRSYGDKFNVFYYADNFKVSTIVNIIFFLIIVQILGEIWL